MALRINSLVKFYTLLLLSEKPKHGYELMKSLDAIKSTKITQGTLYPALQRLEELNLIKSRNETIITEIGVIKNYLSFEDPYFGDGKDRLDFITQEFLYKNNIARNLNILAMNNN